MARRLSNDGGKLKVSAKAQNEGAFVFGSLSCQHLHEGLVRLRCVIGVDGANGAGDGFELDLLCIGRVHFAHECACVYVHVRAAVAHDHRLHR